MNVGDSQYEAQFAALCERTMGPKAGWGWYFDQDSFSGDNHCPIQLAHHLQDFDFLQGLSRRDRDLAILFYAVRVWKQLRDFAIENRPNCEYMCYIPIREDEYTEFGLFFPQLTFIKNPDAESWSGTTGEPTSDFGVYVLGLLSATGQRKGAIVWEWVIPEARCVADMAEAHAVFIDFQPMETERRVPLPGKALEK